MPVQYSSNKLISNTFNWKILQVDKSNNGGEMTFQNKNAKSHIRRDRVISRLDF